jgi:hypothetical protein
MCVPIAEASSCLGQDVGPMRANYALNLSGRPRRGALVLAKARTRPTTALFVPSSGSLRPARKLTLLR